MNLELSRIGDVAVLHLTGRFDNVSAPHVTEVIERTLTTSNQVIVDLAHVPFLDSTALATLVRGMRRCRERGGDLYLCGLQQPVYMIFDLTRLNKAFAIFVDPQQAAQAFTLNAGEELPRV